MSIKERIIIDTDPGIDDATAIILATCSSEINIEALTVVCGNASLEKGTKNAFKILQVCKDNNIPVYQGCEKPLIREFIDADETHGDDGMGNTSYLPVDRIPEKEHAVDYLIRLVSENPNEITLVPIGPLTNIATAIQKDSNFAKNVKKVVLMGGAEFGGNCSPVAEFNIWDDPHAAQIVFNAGFSDLVMVGLDVTRKIIFTPNLREVVRQYNTPLGNFIHSITRFYVDFHWFQEKTLGCVINDPLTIAYLLDENILKLKKSYVNIVTDGPAMGQTLVDPGGLWTNGVCNCRVAYDTSPKIFPSFGKDTKIILEQEFK